jgi:hypothetical protein
MKLGIDIDGVLADFTTGFQVLTMRTTSKKLPPPTSWDYMREVLSPSEMTFLWDRIKTTQFWHNLMPLPEASKLLKVFVPFLEANTDNEVYFITSRPGQRAKLQSEQWLREYTKLTNPTVCMIPVEDYACKGHIAKGLGLDLFIDDNIQATEAVITYGPAKCNVYLIDQPWNQTSQLRRATQNYIAEILYATI